MKNDSPKAQRRPGRPLSFDPQAALASAMLLFWRHGYEATSLSKLTRAMGISPPSIYAAYGDKKGLFRAVVKLYLAQPLTPVEIIGRAANSEAAARMMVEGAAIAYTGADTPPGCLLANAAIAVSAEADDIREELATIRQTIEQALSDKIEADIKKGELPPTTDADGLAAYVITVIQGLSIIARDGATRTKLLRIAQLAMAVWPGGGMQEIKI